MVLFRMGMQASFLIAAILAIRRIFSHRFPPEVYLVLWDAVLARMLIPGFVHSPFSVYSLLPVRLGENFTRNVPGQLQNPLFVIWLGGVLISGSFLLRNSLSFSGSQRTQHPLFQTQLFPGECGYADQLRYLCQIKSVPLIQLVFYCLKFFCPETRFAMD